MIDFLYSLGQAASLLFPAYGGFLVMAPSHKTLKLNPALEDELLLLKHLRNDA